MAYALEHSSKPQTLAHALNDSPAGLAAWILEKFHRWSDCHGDLDSVYDRDDLLTNLTIYWATGTIGSSMRLYYETAHSTTAGYGRVEVPTGMAMSSADMFPTPREWVERQYNVIHWTDLARGGHFLEWEVPTSSPTIYVPSSTPTGTTQEATTRNPAQPTQRWRPTTIRHQVLVVGPAGEPPPGSPVRSALGRTASTAEGWLPGFST